MDIGGGFYVNKIVVEATDDARVFNVLWYVHVPDTAPEAQVAKPYPWDGNVDVIADYVTATVDDITGA